MNRRLIAAKRRRRLPASSTGMAFMFGEIGIEKILLIFGIVLVIFGAKRLPEIGQGLGKGIREFKRATTGTLDAPIAGALEDEPRTVLEPREVVPARAGDDDSPRRLIS